MSDHTHRGPDAPTTDDQHDPDGTADPTGEWRTGGRVPLNVYDPTGRPMFMARTPDDAARMVRLLNLGEKVPAMAAEVASYRDGWRQVFGSNEDADTIMAAHRADGVAAGPQATPGQVLWEGETSADGVQGPPLAPGWSILNRAVQAFPGTRVRVVAAPTDQEEAP